MELFRVVGVMKMWMMTTVMMTIEVMMMMMMMMMVMMMMMMVHIHSMSIRIIHFIVIHLRHLEIIRKIAAQHHSTRD